MTLLDHIYDLLLKLQALSPELKIRYGFLIALAFFVLWLAEEAKKWDK